MNDDEKQTDKTPDKYMSVDKYGTYRGYDPNKPQTYRDRTNERRNGPKQRYAEGTEPDAFGE